MNPKNLLALLLLISMASVGLSQAPDDPPGATPDKTTTKKTTTKTKTAATDKEGLLELSEDMTRIKKVQGKTSPKAYRHTEMRFVCYIPSDKLGSGWAEDAEALAPLVYKKEIEALKKDAKTKDTPFVKEVEGITLVSHKSGTTFTHCAIDIVDHAGKARIITVPLTESEALVEATAHFLETTADREDVRKAFRAAVGGKGP